MVGTGGVETLYRLEDKLHGGLHAGGAQHLRHLAVDVVHAEGFVEGADAVALLGLGLAELRMTGLSDVVEQLPHAALLDEGYGGAEGAELLQRRHVDAVVVGIAYLRRTRHHHNLLGMQAVEYLEDALAQGGAAHDGVVDDDEVVHMGAQGAVGDVVDVGGEVVARTGLRDERAQLDVLPGHLLAAHREPLAAQALHHAVEGHLGGVGDEGEDGVGHIAADGPQDGRRELLAELLALVVDVAVVAAAEIDALEGAARRRAGLEDRLQRGTAVLVNDQRLTGGQLLHRLAGEVEGGLQHDALAGHGNHLVVAVEEGRPDAPGVAHGKHLAGARHAAHHVAAVVVGHRGAQHIGHLHVILDVACDVRMLQPQPFGLREAALHLAVEAVAHPLQRDVGVAVDARRLALLHDFVEDLVDVGHVEVAAQAEVLRPPVVAAQEGVHILQPALARGGVAQVAHIELGPGPLGRHAVEDSGDGVLALGLLAEHVFRADGGLHVDTGNAGTFLPAVVLLLHHEIEFAETVGGRAVFLSVIVGGLQEAHQRHAAFMLELFHQYKIL